MAEKKVARCGSRKTSSGKPCRRPKGWGTDHAGTGSCVDHDAVKTKGKGKKKVAGKAAAKKKQAEIRLARRRAEVARRLRAGDTYREMAAALKVSRQTIADDVSHILKEAKEETRDLALDYRTTELRRLDELIGALWYKAIGRNADGTPITTVGFVHYTDVEISERLAVDSKIDAKAKPVKGEWRRVPVEPDLGAMTQLRWILERRHRILGIDAPIRIDVETYIRQFAQDEGLTPEETEEAVTEGLDLLRRVEAGETII